MKRSLYVLDFEREPNKDMINLLFTLIKKMSEDDGVTVKFGKIAGTGEQNVT